MKGAHLSSAVERAWAQALLVEKFLKKRHTSGLEDRQLLVMARENAIRRFSLFIQLPTFVPIPPQLVELKACIVELHLY